MDWFRRLREWRKYVALIDGQKRLVASRPQRVSDITSRRLGYDDVEFVIVTKNSAGTLLGTINNLRGLYPGCSIMVVDGGSKDDTVEIGKQSGCRVFEGKWNVGAARNLSLSASTRRFLAHVDSDVQLGWGWLELVKPHFEDVGVVAVSGVTLYGFETDEALMAYCLQSGLIGVGLVNGLNRIP